MRVILLCADWDFIERNNARTFVQLFKLSFGEERCRQRECFDITLYLLAKTLVVLIFCM
jgi:hypothetical protein